MWRQFVGIGLLLLVVLAAVLFRGYLDPQDSPSISGQMLALISEDLADLERAKIERERQEVQLEIEQVQDAMRAIPFYRAFKKWGSVGGLSAVGVCLLIVSAGMYRKLTTHQIVLGEDTIPIKDKDLGKVAPEMTTALALARQMEAQAPQRAFELYSQLAAINSKQLQSILGSRGLNLSGVIGTGGPAADDPVALPEYVAPIPTFSELLRERELAPNKPLILGIRADGNRETGKLSDLYSTFTLGESGGGKTTFLTYLIASSILCDNARFTVFDHHYPHEESLGYALGDLIHTPYVQLYSNPIEVVEILREIERDLDRRLATLVSSHPHIVAIDEYEKYAANKEVVRIVSRILEEGRKAGMYLFLTSKGAKGDRLGDTMIRDNCVSSYCFKVRKKVAQTFFGDRDKANMVRNLKRPGMCIFTDRKDDSRIVGIPLATVNDMRIVAQQVNGAPVTYEAQMPVTVSHTHSQVTVESQAGHSGVTGERTVTDAELKTEILRKKDAGVSVTHMASVIGFDRTYLSKWINGNAEMTDTLRDKLTAYVKRGNLVTFPKSQEKGE